MEKKQLGVKYIAPVVKMTERKPRRVICSSVMQSENKGYSYEEYDWDD